jgi:hypothetical protein
MELKPPKAKKKSSFDKLVSWGKMLRAPILILFILGSTTCDEYESSDDLVLPKNHSIFSDSTEHVRHRHTRHNDSVVLSDIKFLRRHLNKEIVNFVMRDFLVDGEVENRIHFNGITAKETAVGTDG